MQEREVFEFNNEEEAEIAQIQSLMSNQNAISAVQQKLAEQRKQPSAEFCEECGEDIPQARRELVPGCQMCVHCQERFERVKANYRQPGASTE
jgi:phage/conjugal plasmid C-4 type zinc finger TraR family protein